MFASVPDPDFPGHVILEQFQAQVRVQAVEILNFSVRCKKWSPCQSINITLVITLVLLFSLMIYYFGIVIF